MITFKSRKSAIRRADYITRKAHSVYSHVSSSRIDSMIGDDKVRNLFWGQMSFEYSLKFAKERMLIEDDTKNLHKHVVEMLQRGLGNCFEEAKLAELIGRINGQKNIYAVKIFAGDKYALHEAAMLTDKKFDIQTRYKLKGKDALILDPWLQVTDFVGKYVEQIKSNFAKTLGIKNGNIELQIDADGKLTPRKIKEFKEKYPELLIDKFEKIKI